MPATILTRPSVRPCTQIRKGILQKVSSGPAYRASLFHGALGLKRWTKSIPIVNTLVGGVLDTVVFKAVKQATGGKLKYAINGGESGALFVLLLPSARVLLRDY